MATTKVRNFGPKEIPLSKDSYLVFDLSDGIYRLAYYYKTLNKDNEPITKRITSKKPKLLDALRVCFGIVDAVHDADLTEEYIRSTEWGKQLP